MKNIKKLVLIFAVGAVVILFTGCLQYSSWTIRYELDRDLEGVLTLTSRKSGMTMCQ